MQCKFREAWIGQCGGVADSSGYCARHQLTMCCSCGAKATRTCDQTLGPLCCGMPLCKDCEHEIAEDGTNGGNLKHCKKSDQKHKPWYMREAVTQ